MRSFSITLICMLTLLSAKAQKQMEKYFSIYQHTINTDEGKLSFHLLSNEKGKGKITSDRTYFWYSSNRIHHTQGAHSGKLLHGLYINFYPNKNIREKGEFKKGLKVGKWKNWNDRGMLINQIRYHSGVAHGPFFLYDSVGRVSQSGSNKRGQINGVLKSYVGDSLEKSKYLNGVLKVRRDKSKGILFYIKNKLKRNPKDDTVN